MNDNLPPLPPCAPEFKPRWPTDPGGYNEEQMQAYARAAIERQSVPAGWMLVPIEPSDEWLARLESQQTGVLESVDADAIRQCIAEFLAAAPQPQPVQPTDDVLVKVIRLCQEAVTNWSHEISSDMAASVLSLLTPQPQPVQPQGPMAETVEEAARDVAKCLTERDGQGLDLRHVAMLVHYAQQPVQQCKWPTCQSEEYQQDLEDQIMRELVGEQPKQEPVAWYDGKNFYENPESASMCMAEMTNLHPLYTSPQAAQPLSDAQITEGYKNGLFARVGLHHYFACGVRFAEIQHGIQPLTAITKGTT